MKAEKFRSRMTPWRSKAPMFIAIESSTSCSAWQIFENAADFGVALLHGHDFLDVFDIAREQIDFAQELGVLFDESTD